MAVPLDQDGRLLPDADALFWSNLDTRTAGGQYIPASATNLVVTDVREFRSAVPCILHAKSLRVLPCTLEVGDYILSPDICVERKSISDLIGSFKSGRLYTQAENMCLHYKTPILLIEFDQNKAFSLQVRQPPFSLFLKLFSYPLSFHNQAYNRPEIRYFFQRHTIKTRNACNRIPKTSRDLVVESSCYR